MTSATAYIVAKTTTTTTSSSIAFIVIHGQRHSALPPTHETAAASRRHTPSPSSSVLTSSAAGRQVGRCSRRADIQLHRLGSGARQPSKIIPGPRCIAATLASHCSGAGSGGGGYRKVGMQVAWTGGRACCFRRCTRFKCPTTPSSVTRGGQELALHDLLGRSAPGAAAALHGRLVDLRRRHNLRGDGVPLDNAHGVLRPRLQLQTGGLRDRHAAEGTGMQRFES
mmetsp:Transcript_11640/g.19124  ORF Transcript_11640/g.19124 Transcript_11640/m.19124 type:complete len:225 (+) Transcript_11640:353-1027(+)